MAEWSSRRTCNPVVLGSCLALTIAWICFTVAPSSIVNSQLICLRPVGILNNELFQLPLLGLTSLRAINTAEGKKGIFIHLFIYLFIY